MKHNTPVSSGRERLTKVFSEFLSSREQRDYDAGHIVDERRLRSSLEFQRIISSLATHFIALTPETLDNGIVKGLRIIGKYARADRSYLFWFSDDRLTFDNTHEWCAPGVPGYINRLQGLSTSHFSWFVEKIQNLDTVRIGSLSDLPEEATKEKAEFEFERIRSMVCVPVVMGGEARGFLGVSSLRQERQWSDSTEVLLKTAAEMFANAEVRKRGADKLMANERRFRAFIDHTPAAIAMFDRSMVYVTASKRWWSEFRVKEIPPSGKSIYEAHSSLPVELRRSVHRAIHGEVAFCNEDVFIRDDGAREWVQWEARPWQSAVGKVGGVIVSLENISERKKTQERLEVMQFSIDRAADGVLWLDSEGVIQYVNDAECEMLGYDREELLGQCVRFIAPNVTQERWRKRWKIAKQEGALKGETVCRANGGRMFPVELTLNYFEREGEEYYFAFARDITFRKQQQEALVAQSKFFRKVIDIAPYFIFAKDREGRFTLVNKAVADAYGTTVEELTGKTDADFNSSEEEVEHFRKDDLKVMDSLEEKFIAEEIITDASGERRWLQTVKLPILDDRGKATNVLGASTDITERKAAEEERRRLEAQIQQAQKLESLGVLAGGIAHDFNNILMGVLGNASLLVSELPEGSKERGRVEKIQSASERAAELTNQLLAYSGKGKFVVSALDLSSAVREMSELLSTAVSKKATIHYDYCPRTPLIEADATQIRQVVMNLIINASEALENKAGEIHIRTGVREVDRQFLESAYLADNLSEGRFVFLEITDTGVGMDEETQQKIFDPFFTTKCFGRGLGLAGVIGIVRSHGGALKVKSAPGEGTSFEVLFPVIDSSKGRVPTAVRKPSVVRSKGEGTILVVDDEEVTRMVAKEMLEHSGYDVLIAEDGEQGLVLFRGYSDSLVAVLLDLTMPRKDGKETFREMQAINPDIPVILSSGYSEQEAVRLFGNEEFAEFLQKPYEHKCLMERLSRALDRKEAVSDARVSPKRKPGL